MESLKGRYMRTSIYLLSWRGPRGSRGSAPGARGAQSHRLRLSFCQAGGSHLITCRLGMPGETLRRELKFALVHVLLAWHLILFNRSRVFCPDTAFGI
jgi:hypothetical protein